MEIDPAKFQMHLAQAREAAGLNLTIFKWKEGEHPRNFLGRFIDKLDTMQPGGTLTLPDGTSVSKDAKGRFRIGVGKHTIGPSYKSATSAANKAFDISAGSTHPGSVGGDISYGHHTDLTNAANWAVMNDHHGAFYVGSEDNGNTLHVDDSPSVEGPGDEPDPTFEAEAHKGSDGTWAVTVNGEDTGQNHDAAGAHAAVQHAMDEHAAKNSHVSEAAKEFGEELPDEEHERQMRETLEVNPGELLPPSESAVSRNRTPFETPDSPGGSKIVQSFDTKDMVDPAPVKEAMGKLQVGEGLAFKGENGDIEAYVTKHGAGYNLWYWDEGTMPWKDSEWFEHEIGASPDTILNELHDGGLVKDVPAKAAPGDNPAKASGVKIGHGKDDPTTFPQAFNEGGSGWEKDTTAGTDLLTYRYDNKHDGDTFYMQADPGFPESGVAAEWVEEGQSDNPDDHVIVGRMSGKNFREVADRIATGDPGEWEGVTEEKHAPPLEEGAHVTHRDSPSTPENTGMVHRVNEDGTYDLVLPDAEGRGAIEQKGVPASELRRSESQPPPGLGDAREKMIENDQIKEENEGLANEAEGYGGEGMGAAVRSFFGMGGQPDPSGGREVTLSDLSDTEKHDLLSFLPNAQNKSAAQEVMDQIRAELPGEHETPAEVNTSILKHFGTPSDLKEHQDKITGQPSWSWTTDGEEYSLDFQSGTDAVAGTDEEPEPDKWVVGKYFENEDWQTYASTAEEALAQAASGEWHDHGRML